MNKRPLLITGGIIIAIAGWAIFRPELLVINKTVNEGFPLSASAAAQTSGGEIMPILTGTFRTGAHETKGTARVHQLTNGSRVLRLTNFETSNGPDVRVLLVAASEVNGNDDVKNNKPIELGPLKGNVGDQNYEVAKDIDLNQYRSVSIWCNRFSVNFGSAPLMPAADAKTNGTSVVMNEAMPAQPTPLKSGAFKSVAHETKGSATVYRLANGSRVLRLSDFETSNGPDVRVLLIAASDAADNATVQNSKPVELGKLKGNVGDQNYDIPASIDLNQYRAVTIWCNRFSVNFGTAALQ
jgi:hypothetical protein